jgi:hypothetical protein
LDNPWQEDIMTSPLNDYFSSLASRSREQAIIAGHVGTEQCERGT